MKFPIPKVSINSVLAMAFFLNQLLYAQDASPPIKQKESASRAAKGGDGSSIVVTGVNVLTDLYALGIITNFTGGDAERVRLSEKANRNSAVVALKEESEQMYKIRKQIDSIDHANYVNAQGIDSKLKLEGQDRIKNQVKELEKLIEKVKDEKFKTVFSTLLRSESNNFTALNALIDEKNNLHQKTFSALYDEELRKSKKLKVLKGVTVIAGAIFAVDALGEVWAYLEDEPRPIKIPGKLAIDIAKNGAEAIGPAILAAIREQDLKTFLKEHRRGMERDFLDEKDVDPSGKPKKH
jgi:hypothetical protein